MQLNVKCRGQANGSCRKMEGVSLSLCEDIFVMQSLLPGRKMSLVIQSQLRTIKFLRNFKNEIALWSALSAMDPLEFQGCT